MRVGILGLSIVNPILLINSSETMQEKMKTDILDGKTVEKEYLLKVRKVKKQWISFFKVELFLELFNQVPIQILLLLLTQTKTGTVSLPGLNKVLEKEKLFGISFDATVLLAISIVWSLFACMTLQLKSVSADKGFFPSKSKMVLLFYAIFATLRRILAFVIFFVPSLGLFNILHHWKWEQIPFKVRQELPELTKPTDKVALYNVSETILWGDFDHNNYDDPQNTITTPYSVYTWLTLKQTFFAFIILASLQFVAMMIVKRLTATDFHMFWEKYSKFVHILENLNISNPYKDWDEGEESLEGYKRRFQNVNKEMACCLIINSVFSILHLLPLWVTGNDFYIPNLLQCL